MFNRKGLMLILSSPSGAGKTSLSRALLEQDTDLALSISATTRPRRFGEREGIDYIFTSKSAFESDIGKNKFLEHAQVFGHYYGTPTAPVEAHLQAGRDVLFDIDWQGTQQIKQKAGQNMVSIFILPPSLAELERRLLQRAQDAQEIVAQRMAEASSEMSHYPEYDYVIINREFTESLDKMRTIIQAERLRIHRQIDLADFVKSLRTPPPNLKK